MSRFSPVPTNSIIDRRLSLRDLSVLSALGCFTDRNGWCTVGMSRIAEVLGTTRQTVQRSITALKVYGYIQTVSSFKEVNGHRVNDVNLTRVLLDFIPLGDFLRGGMPTKEVASPPPLPSINNSMGSITAARGSITGVTQTIQENYSREPEEPDSSEPDRPATEPNPVLVFKTVGKEPEYRLPKAKILEWLEAFPNLEVFQECMKAKAWLEANPTRRKTARGMPRYLYAWLSRAQNNGGTRALPTMR